MNENVQKWSDMSKESIRTVVREAMRDHTRRVARRMKAMREYRVGKKFPNCYHELM